MAQKYPATREHCATCAYWTGHRETDYFGNWVDVDDSFAKGKCMCRGNIWFNTDKIANASCSAFEKWDALK